MAQGQGGKSMSHTMELDFLDPGLLDKSSELPLTDIVHLHRIT
jgi:hypothetical protein